MSNNLGGQTRRGTKALNQQELLSTARAKAVTSQLSQAVGKYALTQSQVDARITSHLIEIGVELESLGARVEKLEHALAPRKKTTRAAVHA